MKKIIFKIITFIFIILITTILSAFFIGTKGLIVKEIKIKSDLIPSNFHGFKIIHLSDIHYGRIIKEKELAKIIEKVNLLKPDIVVLTGDLLDIDKKLTTTEINTLTAQLKMIKPKINKYAISGNHDLDYGKDTWMSIIENSDFTNLDNNYELIYNDGERPIIINGMSSNLEDNLSITEKLEPFNNFMNEIQVPDSKIINPSYKILIMHEPDYIDQIEKDLFNLVLAGHSHNGQVRIPYYGALITPKGATKYYKEHYKINKTDLYISSGLGTSALNVRLFNKPSFNFYRLTINN